MYSNTFIAELEPSILNAACEFIDNLCAQFDTKKRISSHDLNIKGKISLGKANNTKDKDECSVYSSGILTTKNGLPSLNLTFKCWQGGGQIFKWSSYELTKSFLEERGHSTKELSEEFPSPSLTPGKTGQDASKPVTPVKSPSQSKELSFEQKRALATKSYSELGTTGTSPYFQKKGFSDEDLRFLTYIRFGENFIAIPLFASFDDYKNCTPCGIQKIFDDGSKKFSKNSYSSGSFFVIGNIENPLKIAICEGVATGLSIHLATKIPTIVAFNAGNLTPVAEKVRAQFSEVEIFICADNDRWKASEINPNTGKRKGNTGLRKGHAAAAACGGKLVYPVFDGLNYSSKPTDFNDLHILAGIDAVKMQIASPIVPANKLALHNLQKQQTVYVVIGYENARAVQQSFDTQINGESLKEGGVLTYVPNFWNLKWVIQKITENQIIIFGNDDLRERKWIEKNLMGVNNLCPVYPVFPELNFDEIFECSNFSDLSDKLTGHLLSIGIDKENSIQTAKEEIAQQILRVNHLEAKNQFLEKNHHLDELVKQFRNSYPHKPKGLEAEKQLPKQLLEQEFSRVIKLRLPTLSFDNFKGEVLEVERYVKPFTFTITDKKTVVYGSNMGTGKTTAIESSVMEAINKGMTVLTVAHRVSLVQNLAARFRVSFYKTDGINAQNLAICVDSIHKLNGKIYDIVFIDEIEQVLRQILSKKDGKRGGIFSEFTRLISEAQILVIADAHLSDLTMDLIKSLRAGIPTEFHTSKYKFGEGRTCWLWNNQNAMIDDMLMNLGRGRIAVATDSRKESDRLFKRFQAEYPEKKGIVVNNHTRENENVKKLLANINDEINQLDYIIHSPTISSGISIDAIAAYQPFTAHYGVFSPQSGPTSRDAWQQILRFRAKFNVNVFINPRSENRPVDINDLINSLRTKGTGAISEFFQNINDVNELFPAENLKKDGPYYLELQAIVDKNKQINNFKQAFALQAIIDGWTTEYREATSENKNTKINKELIEEADVKALCNAQKIGPTHAEKLRAKKTIQALTDDENNSLKRHEIEAFFKREINEHIAKKGDELMSQVQRIFDVHNKDRSLKIDANFLNQYKISPENNPLIGFTGEALKTEINQLFMEEAGFSCYESKENGKKFLRVCHDSRTLNKKNFDGTFIEKNAEKIRAAYSLRKDFRHNPLQTFFDGLRRMGLGFTCKRGSKGRKSTYICNVDKMNSLNDLLKHIGIENDVNTQKLGVSPPYNNEQTIAQLTPKETEHKEDVSPSDETRYKENIHTSKLGVSPSENIKHEMLSSQLTPNEIMYESDVHSEILKFAGYSIIDGQFVHDGRVLNNQNLLQRGFSEWVIENAKKIEFIHKIPELKGNDREIKEMRQRNFLSEKPMQFLQTFLSDLGLSLKSSPKVIDKKKVYNYTVNKVKLSRLNEILRARNSTKNRVEPHENRCSERITSPKNTVYFNDEGYPPLNGCVLHDRGGSENYQKSCRGA